MDNMSFSEGFFFGTVLTALLLVAIFTHVRDQGRDECDNKLPRTEKCVQVWVPEKSNEGKSHG